MSRTRFSAFKEIVFECYGVVTTDRALIATAEGKDQATFSPAVGVLVGVVLALVIMAIVIVAVMKLQGSAPQRRNYFEEEKLKYPSPIKKDPDNVDGSEKSPDIIPLPTDMEVYATPVVVEMCSASPKLQKQVAEVYYTMESQTCV